MKPLVETTLKWGAAVFVLTVFVGLFFPCFGCQGNSARRLGAQNLMNAVVVACRSYVAEYGRYPVGTPAEIASILMGKNTKGHNPHCIVYLEVRAKDRNPAGELVDPWQTPFRFEGISAAEPPRLSSAGPDRTFGTKDDVNLP